MYDTFDVSKLDKSNEIKDEHRLNILFIFVILDTLNFDKFKDNRFEHPSNILFKLAIFCT